jgi:hypothetical protein
MASVTTNYGFDVPTSSDLVKNGATQIALLGQDLDTFLFRPFTRNGVINSGTNVWQRGTSVAVAASTNAYAADRWIIQTNANQACTISRQVTGDTTNLPNIQYCQRIQRNSGQTGVGGLYTSQYFESINSIPYVGKQVTFSFYARAGANFSAAASALEFYVQTGTGTDQGTGAWTGQASAISSTATLTTTWQRFTATATIPTTATQIKVITGWTPTGTASTNDYYEVTGVQLELGNQVSPYCSAGSSYQAELAMCQRYYFRTTSGVDYGTVAFGGIGTNTTSGAAFLKFPVTMRTNPTAIEYSTLAINDTTAITAITSVTLNKATPDTLDITWNTASGVTQFRPYKVISNNSASGYLAATAEL